MPKTSYSRHHNPYTERGDLDGRWIDDVYRRMFVAAERDLTAIERIDDVDPKKEVRDSLDLLERALRIRRLMNDAFPKRARKKRNRTGQARKHRR